MVNGDEYFFWYIQDETISKVFLFQYLIFFPNSSIFQSPNHFLSPITCLFGGFNFLKKFFKHSIVSFNSNI